MITLTYDDIENLVIGATILDTDVKMIPNEGLKILKQES